jgi:hypothetical protein
VNLATSWYSDNADEHRQITRRNTHARTFANLKKALELGIPVHGRLIRVLER